MRASKSNYPRDVYIVDGVRTPFLKARARPGPFSASDLAVAAGKALLMRQPFALKDLSELVLGCVMPSENEANIGRIVALRLGCDVSMPAYTVQRNCGTGMEAIDAAAKDIALGRAELVIAGGTEAMSHAPLLFNHSMVNWLAGWQSAKNLNERLKLAMKFHPKFLAPVIALMHGLSDPLVGLNMGQTAEILAYRFHITREQMDEFALRSHQRAAMAEKDGFTAEMTALYSNGGQIFELDDGVRHDTSLEQLSKLKPIFDKKFGMVTAGNSSQVTDGAAMLLLASEEAVKKHKLSVLGRIVDVQWAGLEPEVMGLGPVYASTPIMQRHQLDPNAIDYWEINEAFAAQVLACLAAWEDPEFCRKHLGLDSAYDLQIQDRLNVDGGGVALGHPIGASGARIVLHLLHVLQRNKAKLGMATQCIGGGQGGAMLLENVQGKL